jgi:hypothetical protein
MANKNIWLNNKAYAEQHVAAIEAPRAYFRSRASNSTCLKIDPFGTPRKVCRPAHSRATTPARLKPCGGALETEIRGSLSTR